MYSIINSTTDKYCSVAFIQRMVTRKDFILILVTESKDRTILHFFTIDFGISGINQAFCSVHIPFFEGNRQSETEHESV